ncbi:tRNA (adenosine(37)-N6)-threonylcarbamoyltransferase complex transferase subunit TsaD [Companilactobacillus kedongensis]|uniref:tRNA (adenosine(37)-N6)-threonylcarbamoyltransferase complex transferase subunit TsaD n=1 Tax=Companilactobacillus kedongensis TaxID=2486004 RepID=UPI000F7A3697|nr:tRNA (adenosine(37)-N6)-threonylcarbamoyltransferase complex transferase subunit TsaD [Companilactobacillus kedongensis]
MKKDTLILSFESSCDETSVAVIKNGKEILSNIIATQIKSHQRFGGVVPEVASRHHVEEVTHCIELALDEAKVGYDDLDAVAVTYGPGLVGSLLIGIMAAKTVAFAHDLPLIKANHLAGHIYSANLVADLQYPFMALLVSGGHTEIVLVRAPGEFETLGDTRDDAVGEAYDKIGRVLGINYPAGKKVDEMAARGNDIFDFPRAMVQEDNLDFSFSGLKSSFINRVHHADQIHEELNKDDLAASFQGAVLDILSNKIFRALKQHPVKQLVVAGGVAANQGLRQRLKKDIEERNLDMDLIFPPLRLCGDNAAMIGAIAQIQYDKKDFADLTINADPSLDF